MPASDSCWSRKGSSRPTWSSASAGSCTASRRPSAVWKQHRDQSALHRRQRRQRLYAQDAARAARRFRDAGGGGWREGLRREGDGKIVHEGNFMEQCRYAYMKIKKLLDAQDATMNDVVRIITCTTDVRFFQDALKCRAEAFGSAPIPASTFLVVSQLAWPNMAIEVDVTAMLAK